MSRRVRVVMSFVRWDFTPHRVRLWLLRSLGMQIAPGAEIRSGTRFMGPNLVVSPGVLINHDCFFENEQATVFLGANVGVAPRATFITATHEFGPSQRRWGAEIKRDITVGDGCWIGAEATVLPGVTIGRGCLIAAGSVVVEDCVPNGLYAGVPARLVRTFDPD